MPPFNTRDETNDNMPELIQKIRPSVAFVVIIFGALIAFEIFNFSTTERALADLLGNLAFLGLPWSTVLALAFCGIDFAGIARLFTPEQGMNEPKEVWYLFVAWLLAATMNAILTWWGVSMAVITHQVQSTALVDQGTLVTIIPIFVAVMVWVIRILIIGTLSMSMDRLLHPGIEQHIPLEKVMSSKNNGSQNHEQAPRHIPTSIGNNGYTGGYTNPARPNGSSQQRPLPRAASPRPGVTRTSAPEPEDEDLFSDQPTNRSRGEPSYHSISARPSNPGGNTGAGEVNRAGRGRMS